MSLSCFKFFLVILLMIQLTSCIIWPRDEHDNKVYYSTATLAAERHTQKVLYRRYLATSRYLHRLRRRGARTCFPGRWQTAYFLLARIEKELNGHHFGLVKEDLQTLNADLNRLSASLRYVNVSKNCRQKDLPRKIVNQYRKRW